MWFILIEELKHKWRLKKKPTKSKYKGNYQSEIVLGVHNAMCVFLNFLYNENESNCDK